MYLNQPECRIGSGECTYWCGTNFSGYEKAKVGHRFSIVTGLVKQRRDIRKYWLLAVFAPIAAISTSTSSKQFSVMRIAKTCSSMLACGSSGYHNRGRNTAVKASPAVTAETILYCSMKSTETSGLRDFL